MVKSRTNSILLSVIWTFAPIFIPIISFSFYTRLGNQLTVNVALPATALFTMARAPLNAIPTRIASMMRAKVALNRIQAYLDEDEVDGQVLGLKGDTEEHSGKGDLGIIKGSFKWNEVKEKGEKDKRIGVKSVALDSEFDTATTVAESAPEHRFELRDISVIFPDGQLTVITGTVCSPVCVFTTVTHLYHTGPTASGKTALLVSSWDFPASRLTSFPV